MGRTRIAFNPNVVARGDDFFGRESELDLLMKRITHGQNVLITGERRIGKTSLLGRAYALIESQIHQSVQVWIEGDGGCSSIRELAVGIAEALHKRNIVESVPSYSLDPPATVKRILDVLERIAKEGSRLILFINDLDDMARNATLRDAPELASFVRSILDQGHILACATSFQRLSYAKSSERAPLLNVFNELPLGPFSEGEALHLLSESSFRSGDRLLESECAFFTELVGLAPLHLQVAGFSLFAEDEFIGSVGDTRLDLMVAAVEQTVSQLISHWLYALDSLTLAQRFLLGRAARNQTLPESAELQYLKQRGLITPGEDRFKSMGSVYSDFLRSVDLDSSESNRPTSNSYWSFTKDLAQVAIRTLLESGIKTYVK